MSFREYKSVRLSDKDLNFLIDTVSPEVSDRANLVNIIREDEDFRNGFVSDEKVFRKLIDDDAILLKISPTLFFEILLRRALKDLSRVNYTIEKTLTMSIPVFDTDDLVALLEKESLLIYLADMLSSFTRIESYAISIRIRKGFWKNIRFNDLDIRSLMSLCEVVDDHHRFGLYKRIADICLFMLGMFPEYTKRNYQYPYSGDLRPGVGANPRISPEEYEKEGQRFYKLAAEHESAAKFEMSDILLALHDNFQNAKKPIHYIADHFLQYRRKALFA